MLTRDIVNTLYWAAPSIWEVPNLFQNQQYWDYIFVSSLYDPFTEPCLYEVIL